MKNQGLLSLNSIHKPSTSQPFVDLLESKVMASEAPPWHAAYPKPIRTAESISGAEVLEKFNRGEQPGREFLLIDLRKNDHEVRAPRLADCI